MKRDVRPDPERDEYIDQFIDLEKSIGSVRKLIRTLNKADVPVSCGTANGCRLAFERLAVVPAEAPDSWSNSHAYAALRGDLIDLTDTAVRYLANRLALSYSKLKAGDSLEWQEAIKGECIAGRKVPDLSPPMAAFALGVEEQLGRLSLKLIAHRRKLLADAGGNLPDELLGRMGQIEFDMALGNARLDAPKADADWPTITSTARSLHINPGVVSRMIKQGKLKDNGQANRARRVDPASILKYCEDKKVAYNDT